MRLNLPLTGDAELEGVRQVLESGYLTQGPKAAKFESLVAKRVGTSFGFATSSCTTALHLSLVALGVGVGDEVVVPDFTFPATANVVVQQGAVPVLTDVDPLTFNMTAEGVEAAMSERTRAVIVVHAFGQPAEMDPINAVAARHGVPVIEDAACALGGSYRGRPAGGLSLLGCFSFHPRKIITTGEGGLITTNDPDLAQRISVLRSHGAVRGDLYLEFIEAGFNYRLSDLNAAVGLAQLDRLHEIVERRRALAAQYGHALEESGFTPPFEHEDVVHPYQSYVIRVPSSVRRDDVIRGLASSGVESTLGTYSLHNQPYFQRVHGYRSGQFPASDQAFRESLTLPLYPQMTEADVVEVVGQLDRVVRGLEEGR